MTILPAREDDVQEVAELWHEAFPGRRSVDDRARMLREGGRYGGLETVLVARAPDHRLVGACKIYGMQQHITGVAMPMMGLAAVAVPEAERRRGVAARLCAEAIGVAAERGDVVSVLYPFRPDYYERLGWGLVGELREHRFETAALPRHDEEAARVRTADLTDDVPGIMACYHTVASRSNGPLTRDEKVWAYRLAGRELGVQPIGSDLARAAADPGRRVVVFDEHGIDGYALLRFHSGPGGDARRLEVRELVAASERAYRGLLGYLRGLSDPWPAARHFARPEERFDDRLTDPRPPGRPSSRSLYFPVARVVRGPMLRILDLPRALRLRRWFDGDAGPDVSGTVRVRTTDPQRPGNDGPWDVRLDGPGMPSDVKRAEGGAVTAEVTGDPATVARLFVGEIRPSEAARQGRAAVDGEVHFLDRAFTAADRFWLLDEF